MDSNIFIYYNLFNYMVDQFTKKLVHSYIQVTIIFRNNHLNYFKFLIITHCQYYMSTYVDGLVISSIFGIKYSSLINIQLYAILQFKMRKP